MMDIGIIGVQSKHFDFFVPQINGERRFGDARVVCVWGGDDPARLPAVAEAHAIPRVCQTREELIAHCDTVFILTRDGRTHSSDALAALAAGRHVLVDKAFALSGSEADAVIAAASRQGLALTGGSTLCHLPEIPGLAQQAAGASLTLVTFTADPDSEYGGWTYYGSHLTDLCARICGTDARQVRATRNGKRVTAIVQYPDGRQAVLHSSPEKTRPEVTISGPTTVTRPLDDQVCYRHGLEAFYRELKGRSNESHKRLRFSAHLLDACLRSIESGQAIDLQEEVSR